MKMLKERTCSGIEMILDKFEKIGREKQEWTFDEVCKAADVIKDMPESIKNIAQMHYYLSEHSMEKF